MIDSTGPNRSRRVARLTDYTVLTELEAEIQAHKEMGRTHKEIAEKLDLSETEVDNHDERIDQKMMEVKRTVQMLLDVSNTGRDT